MLVSMIHFILAMEGHTATRHEQDKSHAIEKLGVHDLFVLHVEGTDCARAGNTNASDDAHLCPDYVDYPDPVS